MEDQQSFKNQFLVALPGLAGDYFNHTVSLMIEHNADGAFGLVINQPSEYVIRDVFQDLPDDVNCPLLVGGPVEQDKIFFLHPPEQQFEGTLSISPEISLTTSPDFVDALRAGSAPDDTLACLGYAGWAAAQLEQEIARNVWLLTPTNPDVVFKEKYENRPQAAAKLLGIDLHLLAPRAGHD